MKALKWAQKVKPALLERVYASDAAGMLDEEALNEAGFALWLRCRSVVFVSTRRVECPQCLMVFDARAGDDDLIHCPTPQCNWHITTKSHHESWRHKDLIGVRALDTFTLFIEQYPQAQSSKDKLLLIDQLVHAFHWDMKLQLPNRSVGNNLIQGSHEDVVTFLDRLTLNTTDPASKDEWRRTVNTMWQRRRAV
jgi:hypothetical protein